MLLRVRRSQEKLLRRNLGFLNCTIRNIKDFALVVEVDDDDYESFMGSAEDIGMDVDEYDEALKAGRPTPKTEPYPMGGNGEWRELI